MAFLNIPAVKWGFRFHIPVDLLGFKPQHWVHNFTVSFCAFVHRDDEARVSLHSKKLLSLTILVALNRRRDDYAESASCSINLVMLTCMLRPNIIHSQFIHINLPSVRSIENLSAHNLTKNLSDSSISLRGPYSYLDSIRRIFSV